MRNRRANDALVGLGDMEPLVTRNIELDSVYTQDVLGINDTNLRVLNQHLGADVHARGNAVTVRGPEMRMRDRSNWAHEGWPVATVNSRSLMPI